MITVYRSFLIWERECLAGRTMTILLKLLPKEAERSMLKMKTKQTEFQLISLNEDNMEYLENNGLGMFHTFILHFAIQ